MRLLISATVAFVTLAAALPAADPATAFQSWSAFNKVDVRGLSAGKIVTSANASMSMAHGLSAQAVYIVSGSLNHVTQTLLTFDPSKHPGLDSIQHHLFRDASDAGFEKLTLDPRIPAVGALLKTMRERSGLQLSKEEAARLPGTSSPDAGRGFLIGILGLRWKAMAERGELGSTGNSDTRAEIRSLLGEEPGMATHFARLLAPVTVKGGAGAPKFHYWDLANVNKTAAIDLGVLYTLDVGERRQVLDVTYYAGSGYLAAVTLWEFVPITTGGQDQTLVWQCSLVSSNELVGAFGLKRKIASRIIVSDMEKWIHVFQRETARESQH